MHDLAKDIANAELVQLIKTTLDSKDKKILSVYSINTK